MKDKAKKSLEDAKERAELNRPDDDKVQELIEDAEQSLEDEEWFELIDKVRAIEEHLDD